MLAACGAKASENRSLDSSGNQYEGLPRKPGASRRSRLFRSSRAAEAPASGGGGEAAAIERLVIQNADLAIVVSDVEDAHEGAGSHGGEMGGYVVLIQQISNLHPEWQRSA